MQNIETKNIPTSKPIFVHQEMSSSYLSYAMSVIVSRALPDVRDGLKPVHRRIICMQCTKVDMTGASRLENPQE